MTRALVFLLLAGCAAPDGGKGPGGLQPFGPQGLTQVNAPQRLALLIGVEQFLDKSFGRLSYPQDDALAMGAALSKEGFDEVQVLTTPEETTRAAVLDALADLAAKIRAPEDTILVYISSHGTLAHPPGRPLERFLVLSDTRLRLAADTGLSVRELISRIEGLPSARKAIVLATCHSGEGKSELPDPLIEALAQTKAGPLAPLVDVSEAILVLSAAAFGETARESHKLGSDIYTHFLLKSFTAGDRDGDGAITASEAHDYARERTYLFSGGSQRPTLVGTVLGADPVVLAGRRAKPPRPILFSYSPAAEGLSVVVDGQSKGDLPGGVAVEPGRHQVDLVVRQSGERLWSGSFDIEPQSTTDLARLIPPPPSFNASIEARTMILLDQATRDRAFAPIFGAAARFRASDLLKSRLILEAGVAGGTGSNTLQTGEDSWSQSVTAIELNVAAGLRTRWRRLDIVPGIGIGGLWARRAIDLPGQTVAETLTGLTVASHLRLEYAFSERYFAGLRLEVGGLAARVVDKDFHPFIGASLGIGIRP